MRLEDFERTLPPSMRWENLTLANYFMFSKVMCDAELCTEMIRRILPDDDVSGELKAFLDFMLGKSCDDPFIMRLEERLNELKQKTEWRRNYMLLLTREEESRIEGVEIGRELERKEMLSKVMEAMRLNGISNEQIDNIRNAVLKS